YYEFGLDQRTETDARSLLGRLKKDQAFAETGEARTASFREGHLHAPLMQLAVWDGVLQDSNVG
ncbi:MAG: hypothetical protein WCD33_25955, partial [Mycobacterium sp.]|uniref:hypothetical protein n=1 Tax=Mycobacterium sp. TaxID=1785 RepID=UPI003C72B60E